MEALADETLAAMERESRLYDALLALAEEQRSCLIRGEAPRLERIVAQESDLLLRASRASRRTQAYLGRLAGALGLPQGWSGGDLAHALPTAAARRYETLRRRILSQADQLARLSMISRQLASGALAYIDFSLRLMGAANQGAQPYAPDGSPPGNQPGNLVVDTRV